MPQEHGWRVRVGVRNPRTYDQQRSICERWVARWAKRHNLVTGSLAIRRRYNAVSLHGYLCVTWGAVPAKYADILTPAVIDRMVAINIPIITELTPVEASL